MNPTQKFSSEGIAFSSDGPILLQCGTSKWSGESNNWLSFDRKNFCMRAMATREQALPLILHGVSGLSDTYTIRAAEAGWLGLGNDLQDVFLNQSKEQCVCISTRIAPVILKCQNNNRYITHRNSGGQIVACTGNGRQCTKGDIDYRPHIVNVRDECGTPSLAAATKVAPSYSRTADSDSSAVLQAKVNQEVGGGGCSLTDKL